MRKIFMILVFAAGVWGPEAVSGQAYTNVGTVKEGENVDSAILRICQCVGYDGYTLPRESHVRFGHWLADGKWNIRSANRDYGTYDKILFMRETAEKFVAVVSAGGANYFLDMDGKRALPADARVTTLVTNADLSRAAIVLGGGSAMPIEKVNQLSREEQVAFFEKMRRTDTLRRVWLSDGSFRDARKNSKLSFDMTGRHFLDIRPKVFYIDGVENRRDVSGGGTQLFVNQSGSNWAYFYMIYLTFKDNFTIKEARHPFVRVEDGKEYLYWFIADRTGGGTVLKMGRRAL